MGIGFGTMPLACCGAVLLYRGDKICIEMEGVTEFGSAWAAKNRQELLRDVGRGLSYRVEDWCSV